MSKRAVLVRFGVLVALVLAASVLVGWQVHRKVDPWTGWGVIAAAVVVVAMVTFACFTRKLTQSDQPLDPVM